MLQSHQELTKSLPQSLQQNAGGSVLGVAKKAKRKIVKPKLIYQQTDNPDLTTLDKAFDILFEETLNQKGSLTSYDNLV